MFILPWNSKYEIGILPIDEQHQQIFIKANSFAMKRAGTYTYQQILDTLMFLENFSMQHFQVEESHMITSGYPEAMTHQAQHKSLAFRLKQLKVLGQGHHTTKEDLMDKVVAFITEWLCCHIAVEDMKFGLYCKEK